MIPDASQPAAPDHLPQAVKAFDLSPGEAISELGDGHIHRTFAVGPGTIVQRINQHVFRDVHALLDNGQALWQHLSKAARSKGAKPNERILRPLETSTHDPCWADGDGHTWRAWARLPGSTLPQADTEQVFLAAEAFGRFDQLLAEFVPLNAIQVTISGFHDLPQRRDALRSVLRKADPSRLRTAGELCDDLLTLSDQLPNTPALPARLVHNDAKLSNLLWKDTRVQAVIDFDTVMPGQLWHDLGDLLRSFSTDVAEDERDLARVEVDPDRVQAVCEGFVYGLGKLATPGQRRALTLGAVHITLEQALRFLTDYLQMDRYYRTLYPTHNLIRARVQQSIAYQLLGLQDAMRRWLSSRL